MGLEVNVIGSDMKTCTNCAEEKSSLEFYRDSSRKDGRNGTCKICSNAYSKKYCENNPKKVAKIKKKWRKNNLEKSRKNNREYNARNPKSASAASKRYAEANPEKAKIHRIVKKAIENGILIRPDVCEICETRHNRIHGHHEDYNKPLEVIWMCPICHSARHEELK
jgi:hypothetical protein